MIQITEATAIALHSMIYITARTDEITSMKEIAKSFNVSENHLSKVLQKLVKAGYLISTKGPKGGFSIVPEKKEASLMDIYEVIEGRYIRKNCLFGSGQNNSCCCLLGELVCGLNDTFETFMNNRKITDFKL